MKLIPSILFLICCFAAAAYGTEFSRDDRANRNEKESTGPKACPESDKCPRDSHPVGTPCPHNPD